MKKAYKVLLDKHFWIITIITTLIGFGYYGEHIGLDDWAPIGKSLFRSDYTHDVHRVLLLIPLCYAAVVFRLKGVLALIVVVFAIILPRGLTESELPDPLFRSVTTTLIISMVAILFALERERSQRITQEMMMRHESEQKRLQLANIVESSEEAIIGKSLDGIITAWNKGAKSLYGYSQQEAIGQPISMLIPPGHEDDQATILKRIRADEKVERYETVRMRKDGSLADVSLTVSPIKNETGQVIGASTIARDITERKRSEDALKESEARYRSLFEHATDGILLRNLDGTVIMANQAMSELSGYSISELEGMNIAEVLPEDSLEIVMNKQKTILQSIHTTSSERYEIDLICKNGSQRIVEAVTSVLQFGDGPPIIQALVRDVTQQKNTQDQLQAYSSQIIQAQEDERKRIARELHDETIQFLASLGLEIDGLHDSYKRMSEEEVGGRLETIRMKTDNLLMGVRHITQDLRPPMLDELGLVFALQWLADNTMTQAGIEVQVNIVGNERRYPSKVEMLLFRIAQEALTNVRKHSRADSAGILLEYGDNRVQLTIHDNGIGFELPESGTQQSIYSYNLGLVGMRERAKLLGSELSILSEPGKGTTVKVEYYE